MWRRCVSGVNKIHSENNDFQHIEVLKRNRLKRHRYREFFVEGVIPITRAVECGWSIVALVYPAQRRLSNWARETIERAGAETLFELAPELMDKISDKEDASELVGIVAMPGDDLPRLQAGRGIWVLFDRPSNHGNLGAIIRSCDAFGAGGLIMTGHAVDLYDPRTIRASVGSLFALPVIRLPSYRQVQPWTAAMKDEQGLQIVGTSAKAMIDILDVDFRGPTLLVVGNETRGLSNAYQDICDVMVRIPMYGSATSLNVACATSVLLYEVDRQRRG
jgi:tRNA G18 (ribose-2'-O)-methylase SpoU